MPGLQHEVVFNGNGLNDSAARAGCFFPLFAAAKAPSLGKNRSKARLAPTWLGWQDSNLRMPESKSGALPLGDIPMSGIVVKPTFSRSRGASEMKNGVSEGTRTLGLQSHNLTR